MINSKLIPEESEKSKRDSAYKPHRLRTHPFKWINFPVFVCIWFVLFWFILCPIIWAKALHFNKNKHNTWPTHWPYYFWGAALLIFCFIMIILILIWKCLLGREKEYDSIFMNPEYGDHKEILCIYCMNFHVPGKINCPKGENSKWCCQNCGNAKETFNKCCQKAKIQEERTQGPSYDVVLRTQQPNVDVNIERKQRRHNDIKRNSLRSVRSRNSSSSSVVVISPHEMGTKDLVSKNYDFSHPPSDENKTSYSVEYKKSVKSKKPPNLKPVDVELANRQSNVEFFGEKIPLGTKKKMEITQVVHRTICEPDHGSSINQQPQTGDDVKSGSVSKMDSMDKDKFNDYLHIVQINTPFTPEDTSERDKDLPKSPLSPREMFFYDLIQAAEKNEGDSPDSTHFGVFNKFEKKRPVSHILMSSDVKLEDETDETKLDALRRYTLGHTNPVVIERNKDKMSLTKTELKANPPKDAPIKKDDVIPIDEMNVKSVSHFDHSPEIDGETKRIVTTVRILRTVKKSTTEADALTHPKFLEQVKKSSMSEQNSVQDLGSINKESVSRFFITDLYRGPPKLDRTSSGGYREEYSARHSIATSSQPNTPDIDDVFSE